ncbi:RDD family protein [Flavobacteriaceae bacterium AU392]|nr:RDD family protein [Flavobacteriaceae bacterium]RKM84091.1 RDD family protein [Flavobacteriaceae bacterium AU392]
MNEINLPTELKTVPNIGKRILAGIVDYLIICIFYFIFLLAFGEPDSEGELYLNGLPVLGPILFWGIMTIGLEQWFGATLGNSLVDLKPISICRSNDNSTFSGTDEKLTFEQSLKRHLLDPIDLLFFGLIGIITIKKTDKNQRLGDIWGNTIVVKTSELKKKE